jgi:hypothetical protein
MVCLCAKFWPIQAVWANVCKMCAKCAHCVQVFSGGVQWVKVVKTNKIAKCVQVCASVCSVLGLACNLYVKKRCGG